MFFRSKAYTSLRLTHVYRSSNFLDTFSQLSVPGSVCLHPCGAEPLSPIVSPVYLLNKGIRSFGKAFIVS